MSLLDFSLFAFSLIPTKAAEDVVGNLPAVTALKCRGRFVAIRPCTVYMFMYGCMFLTQEDISKEVIFVKDKTKL